MNNVIFTEQFDKSFSKIKDNSLQKQIWKKISEFETRAPLGKKLKGNPYWSIHIHRYRVYELKGNQSLSLTFLKEKMIIVTPQHIMGGDKR